MILEHDYKTFLNNKRVAFIGPAPNLKGRGLGEFIDSFDIVVRTNHFIELVTDPEIQKDYGKKTTVLYVNRQYYREMKPFDFSKWARRGVEWVCAKYMKPKDRKELRKHMRYRDVRETLKHLTVKCPSVLMGVVAMSEIVEARPKEFYVDGIDFNSSRKKVFEVGNYQEYVPGYLPPVIEEQGNRINSGKTEDGHDMVSNTRIIYNMWQAKEIIFPEHIENILCGIMSGTVQQP